MCAKAKDTDEMETAEGQEKKTRGPYNNTIKSLMDIWNVLAAHASPDHPLTSGQIAAYLKREDGPKAPKARDDTLPSATHASELTVERYLSKEIDAINTLFPHTVLRQSGEASILHTYGHNGTLHVVLENPTGEPLWDGEMQAVFQESAVNPIPYPTLNRKLPQIMEQYDVEKGNEISPSRVQVPPISLAGVVAVRGRTGQQVYIPASQWEASIKNEKDPKSGKKAENPKRAKQKKSLTSRSEPSSPPRRYYLDSILTPAEWRMLSDLILVYPYISEEQTRKFLAAMMRLAPGVRNWSGARYAQKTPSAVQFGHIQMLDDAIREQHKVSIQYGKYQLTYRDRRWQPELVPPDGSPMLVEPYAMMWSNGYYYLVCRDGEIMRNLRVDRILKILPTTLPFEPDPNFDPYAYRDRSPVMYPGKPEITRLRCQTSLLSTLMDFFGTTITSYTAPTPDGYTTVSLRASEAGTRLFALQYADRVEVLEPASLREEVKSTLQAAAKQYE